MEKLSVSYYLPEEFVTRMDERASVSGNRSKQLYDDLSQFYDMLDFGLKAALRVLDAEELRVIIKAINARTAHTLPTYSTAKPMLKDIVLRHTSDSVALTAKIEAFDNLTCYALFDWARANT